MKDINGHIIKNGDILLELRRGSLFINNNLFNILKLWEMNNVDTFNGDGYIYNIANDKHSFKWACPSNSIIVKRKYFPINFYYSFYHGMSDLYTTSNLRDIHDLINNSNWKNNIVKKEHVEQFNFRKSILITSIKDIEDNIIELNKDGYVPHELMNAVLKVASINNTNPNFGNFKGEIGMAYNYDMQNYNSIIKYIALNKKEG